MNTEQKDQQVIDNRGGQQKQGDQSKQRGNPSHESTTTVENDQEQTGLQKEREGKKHPHEYKTPVAEQNSKEENQNQKQVSNQGAE